MSEPLDREDREALDRVDGSANQGAAPSSPGAAASQEAAAPTQGAHVFAGYVATLANEFFIRRFGPDKALSPTMVQAITDDTARAIDTYLPNIEAKPGIFSAVIVVGHYIACAKEASGKPSASSAKAGPEKPHSLNGSSEAERAS